MGLRAERLIVAPEEVYRDWRPHDLAIFSLDRHVMPQKPFAFVLQAPPVGTDVYGLGYAGTNILKRGKFRVTRYLRQSDIRPRTPTLTRTKPTKALRDLPLALAPAPPVVLWT